MLNPFLLMAVFYLIVAIVAAADAALTGFTLLPWFVGLPWLRVHFITLGVLTEAAFGVLPNFVAARRGAAPPATRWEIWLALNAGLVVLLAGIPSINAALIVTGGTLVFVAVLLLIGQLRGLGAGQGAGPSTGSLKFYVAGLIYLLVGILIGTGLWVGWSEPLCIGVPKEAHIHANSWGFASLVFAGLLIDLLPQLTGAPLASRRVVDAIFWGMTLGALGLVAGPWLGGMLAVTAPGLVLHIAATAALVVVLVHALRRGGLLKGRRGVPVAHAPGSDAPGSDAPVAHAPGSVAPGAWHLVVSYVWILLPVLVAPLIILEAPGIVGPDVEGTAPQALVYGWMLQFLYAAVPFFAARWLLHDGKARLGGNWLSFAAVNLGSATIWASIFLADYRSPLQGIAYVLLGVSLVAAAWEAGMIALAALRRAEAVTASR